MFDMSLTNADSSKPGYIFHIPREVSEGHLTLHKGPSPSAPIVAATLFDSSWTGHIRCGTPGSEKALQSDFQTLQNQFNTDVTFTSTGSQPRKWRWQKVYESDKKHIWSKTRNHIEWILSDITDSTEGPTLATLVLEIPDPELMLKERIQAKEKGGETGNFVWYSPSTQTEEEQDMAIMSVLALWHRDRQTRYAEPLGPTVDVKIPRRTLENSYHPWGWAGNSYAGIGGG